MARLPDADTLRRTPAPAETPGIRVGAIDYGPTAVGGKAIASGLSSVAGGLKVAADAQSEVDDFDTRKKLIDFKLATEMELEEYKRTMPAGGNGFADSWQKTYKKRADEFFGKRGANIPESQRDKVDLALVTHDASLSERAQRSELAERDRFTIDGIAGTINRSVDAVQANPDNLEVYRKEGERLIELSPISPAAKSKVLADFRRQTAETAFKERVARAQSIADPAKRIETIEGLRKDLKAHIEDMPEGGAAALSPTYVEAIKRSEGYTAKATWDYKQNSVGYGTRAKSADEVIDKAEAERRLHEELGKAATIVDKFAPSLDQGTRAALISLTFNAGDEWTRSGLGKAVKAGDLETAKSRFVEYNKAGGEENAGLARRRAQEAAWFGTGGPQPQAAQMRPEGSADPEAMGGVPSPQYGVYDGPYQGLKAGERRKLDRHASEALKTSLFAQHADFLGKLDDDVRSRRETGVGRQDLDLGLARKVLTPNQMRTYELRRSAAEYEYELRANIENMPLEDIRERLKTMKPAEGGEEYGRRSVAYNRTIAKVHQLRQMREKDPAGSIDTTPEVEQARTRKDPHVLMDARIAKQKAIGIPDQRQSPITREEAQALAAPLAGYKGAEIAKPLQDLSAQILKQYGAHGPGALRMVARVISQDREAQDVMMGEMEKMTRRPGMEVYNPRKLKELEEISKLEMRRRPSPAAPEAFGPAQPAQPNTGALQHLLQNPHLAPFFDQKYGLAPGTGEKYLKQLGR